MSPPAIDLLERRSLLSSGTLTPVVQFNGANGLAPQAVVMDASGNLFGITYDSAAAGVSYGPGQHGPGEVFEVPAGTQTINVLATFSQDAYVGTSLVIDAAGDLFGTEQPDAADGGSGLPTILFEIRTGTTTPQTIATIAAGTSGTFTLTAADPSGDVFGISTFNGPFEVAAGSNTVSYLTPQGSSPIDASDLYGAPDGTIYGTTYAGGDNSDGSLFKFSAAAHAYTQLASFDGATTGSKPIGVVADSAGNLFGFCENGGPNSNGTVFELPAGSNTIAVIGTFTTATGDTPISRPALGSDGILYGLTDSDGANGFGSFFSVATPDATTAASINPESVGLPGGDRDDSIITPLENSSSSTANDLVDFDGTEETGQGTAGVVSGNDPGDDDISNTADIYGGQFGSSSNPDSVGGPGGIDQYKPSTPIQPAPPDKNAIKKLKDDHDGDLIDSDNLNDLLRLFRDSISAIGDNPADSISNRDGDTLDEVENQLSEVLRIWQALQSAGQQYDAAQSQIQSLSKSDIITTRLHIEPFATETQALSGSAAAKKLAAEEAIVARLGPEMITEYNTAEADLATVATELASVKASLATLPSTAILAATITKDTLPASVLAGSKLHGSVALNIANTGVRAKGTATVTLYASTTPTLTNATPIGTPKSLALNILGGRSATIVVPLTTLPESLAQGNYYIVTQLSFDNLSTARAASSQTITVAPAFVNLAASFVSLHPGKSPTAVLSITNTGNASATGPLLLALSARPAGTTGDSDIALQPDTVKLNAKPQTPTRVPIHIILPPSLPTGTYQLVVQLDPDNAFSENSIPSRIVSLSTFTVSS